MLDIKILPLIGYKVNALLFKTCDHTLQVVIIHFQCICY